MSSTEFWTYVTYGISAILFLIPMFFIGMMVISSQNAKKNPIALPKAQKPVEVEEEEVFSEEEKKGALAGGLPTGRRSARKAPPLVRDSTGKLKSSSIFEDEDETFRIAGGKD